MREKGASAVPEIESPNLYCSIGRPGHYQLRVPAHVHAQNWQSVAIESQIALSNSIFFGFAVIINQHLSNYFFKYQIYYQFLGLLLLQVKFQAKDPNVLKVFSIIQYIGNFQSNL